MLTILWEILISKILCALTLQYAIKLIVQNTFSLLQTSREAIVALTKHCRNLVKIYFSARDIDDAIMKQFFLLCRSTLESLDVDLFDTAVNIGVCVAEYRGMSAYLEYCPNLKSFDIFSLKSEVIAVGQYCPDLSEVALMHLFSIDIDDQGLIVLFEGCRKIQKLEIHLPSFTNAVMLKAIECCRDLKHITLSSCIISAESMESLAANCPLVGNFDLMTSLLPRRTFYDFLIAGAFLTL